MQVFGLRLVNRSARPLRPAPAVLRAVLCLVFPAGLLWVAVSRRNASLQDLVLHSTVIYDSTYGPPNRSGAVARRAADPRRVTRGGARWTTTADCSGSGSLSAGSPRS